MFFPIVVCCTPPYRLSSIQQVRAVGLSPEDISRDISNAINKVLSTRAIVKEDSSGKTKILSEIVEPLTTKIGKVDLKTIDLQDYAIPSDQSTKVPPKYTLSQNEIKRCLETSIL
jgi:hypothetical protein